MADMDTVTIRNREEEFISVTLGPKGHELTRVELLRYVADVLKQDPKERISIDLSK